MLPLLPIGIHDNVGGPKVHKDVAEDTPGAHIEERDRLRQQCPTILVPPDVNELQLNQIYNIYKDNYKL